MTNEDKKICVNWCVAMTLLKLNANEIFGVTDDRPHGHKG